MNTYTVELTEAEISQIRVLLAVNNMTLKDKTYNVSQANQMRTDSNFIEFNNKLREKLETALKSKD